MERGKGCPFVSLQAWESDPHKDLYKGPLALRGGDKWRRKGGDKRDPRAGNASLWVWEARWTLFSQSCSQLRAQGKGE